MKIKFYPPILLFLLACLVLVFSNSCGKDDPATPRSGNCTNGKSTAVFTPAAIYGTMTDQDGNMYKTVTIKTQTWMAENLRTTKYRDGSDIPLVYVNTEWSKLTTGAYCNYETTNNCDTIATFGRLYNCFAATDPRNIAPAGWHVPTRAEWEKLDSYGEVLKETGTTHWLSPNAGASNLQGFTALPSGSRSSSGQYNNIGKSCIWWSSSEYLGLGVKTIWTFSLSYKNYIGTNLTASPVGLSGFSIRCVKD